MVIRSFVGSKISESGEAYFDIECLGNNLCSEVLDSEVIIAKERMQVHLSWCGFSGQGEGFASPIKCRWQFLDVLSG